MRQNTKRLTGQSKRKEAAAKIHHVHGQHEDVTKQLQPGRRPVPAGRIISICLELFGKVRDDTQMQCNTDVRHAAQPVRGVVGGPESHMLQGRGIGCISDKMGER